MLLKCAIGIREPFWRLTMKKLNEEQEIRIQRIVSSIDSRLEKLQQTINDCMPNLSPCRRDASKASPYTEKDKLTESEKKEISKKFCSSSLNDKYLHL